MLQYLYYIGYDNKQSVKMLQYIYYIVYDNKQSDFVHLSKRTYQIVSLELSQFESQLEPK